MVACVIVTDVELRRLELIPRCREADVDPEWWIDQDTDAQVYDAQQNRDQLRASLLCYECPLLRDCRRTSWDEPSHVWGGLTAEARYRARQLGEIKESGLGHPKRQISLEALQVFLKGATTDDVAATVAQSEPVTYGKLRRELQRRRLDTEGKWGSTREVPPQLPENMSYLAYRQGGALRQEFLLGPEDSQNSNPDSEFS